MKSPHIPVHRRNSTAPSARRRTAALGLMLLVWCGLASTGAAQNAPVIPPARPAPRGDQAGAPEVPAIDATRIQGKIDEIEAATEFDAEIKKSALEAYRQALSAVKKASDFATLAQTFRQAIETAPEETRKLRAELESEPAEDATSVSISEDATGRDLEVRLASVQAELATARANLEKKESEVKDTRTRPEKAREEQVKARARLDEITTSLQTAIPEGQSPVVTDATRVALEARRLAATEEIAMLEQEVLSQPMRLDLLTAQRDVAAREVKRIEARITGIQEALDRVRARDAEATRQQAEQQQLEASGKHPLLGRLAAENTELTDELTRIVDDSAAVTPVKQLTEKQQQQLQEDYETTQTQLENAGLSGVGGSLMQEQRRRIPEILRANTRVVSRWRGKISEVQARRFRINMDRRDLSDLDARVQRELAEVDPALPEGERQEIAVEVRKLLEMRRGLLTKLGESYDSYLSTLRGLSTAQASLEDTATRFATLLDEWLLWIPSSGLPDTKTAGALMTSLAWLVSPRNWIDTGRVLLNDVFNRPVVPALVVIVFVALLVLRPRLRRHIVTAAGKVGKYRTDSFSLTLSAFGATILVAVAVPLLIWFIGLRLAAAGTTAGVQFAAAVGAGLLAVAQLYITLRVFVVLCRPQGVAEAHFRWREKSLKLIRRHMFWLVPLLVVTTFVVTLADSQTDDAVRVSLGRLAFLVAMGGQMVFVNRVLRPKGPLVEPILTKEPNGWLARLRYIWYPLAVGAPIALAVTSVIGYHYTALQLERRIIITAWLIIGIVVVRNLVLRWLVVEARRLAIEKAREKREAEAKAAQARAAETGESGGSGSEVVRPNIEVPEVDILTINDQTRQLLKALTVTAVVVGLWLTWAGVLPALAILDDVQLWSTQVVDAAGQMVPKWITLEHVALALIALALTAVAAKNLPGVLEIAVLKNLPLDAGVRYALTTVSQYVVVAIGVVVAFKAIGVGWSNIQWLVAALSFGVGFGLQEIIANFFCGLILLFERPIRIGDIVQVGDTMGIVSKIRIRATTITNWDRMELILPNKELITGRLLNWTLSNTVNRIVVSVGVAYGSDTEKARQILLRVAAEHPLVMKDPGPLATFEGFGDSTLNIVLRCYLPDFANRLAVINELHQKVDEAFKEAEIEIAFPQLDLHFKNVPPEMQRELRGSGAFGGISE